MKINPFDIKKNLLFIITPFAIIYIRKHIKSESLKWQSFWTFIQDYFGHLLIFAFLTFFTLVIKLYFFKDTEEFSSINKLEDIMIDVSIVILAIAIFIFIGLGWSANSFEEY